MIQFKSLRQYSSSVNGIIFPNKPGENFVLTYFSENSSLLKDYPRLNLRLMDFRIGVIPVTKVPKTRLTPELIKSYKHHGIITYSSIMKVPISKNVIYDLSQYFEAIDYTFNPTNYRQRLRVFIKNVTNQSFLKFQNFQKVLVYSVDLTKENLNKFVDRKFFPIIQQLKDGSFQFDHLIFLRLSF